MAVRPIKVYNGSTWDDIGTVQASAATSISTDTTNFAGNLSTADTTVQKALDTLDNLTVSAGGISTYTPALTASSVNPTLGSGSYTSGRYTQIGKLVTAWPVVKFGTTGSAYGTGYYYMSLPVTARTDANATLMCGYGWVYKGSTYSYLFAGIDSALGGDKVYLYRDGVTNLLGASDFSSGTRLVQLTLTYEAA